MPNKDDVLLYFERLRNHDWFYYYSDDANVNGRGVISENEIRRMSHLHKLYRQMYDEYSEAMRTGVKKPELNKYLTILENMK